MRNTFLEKTILNILNRVETGLREKTLQDEVDLNMDRPMLTTDDFQDALRELEDRELITREVNLIGENLVSITSRGKAARKGA